MKEEIFKRIDALAVKLGVTAQYLWGVLVKQAGVEAVKDLVWAGFFTVGTAALLYTAYKFLPRTWKRKEGKYGEQDYVYDWDQRDAAGCVGWTALVLGIICVIPALIFAGSAFTPLMNPEYWAFQEVMGLIK